MVFLTMDNSSTFKGNSVRPSEEEPRSIRTTNSRKGSLLSKVFWSAFTSDLKDKGFSQSDGIDGRKGGITNKFVSDDLERAYLLHIEKDATSHVFQSLQLFLVFDIFALVAYITMNQNIQAVLYTVEIAFVLPYFTVIYAESRTYLKYYKRLLVLLFVFLVNVPMIRFFVHSDDAHVKFLDAAFSFPYNATQLSSVLDLDPSIKASSSHLYYIACQGIVALKTSAILFTSVLALPFFEVVGLLVSSFFFQTTALVICYLQSGKEATMALIILIVTLAFAGVATANASHGIDTHRRQLYMHEKKLVRKLSSFRKVIVKQDGELKVQKEAKKKEDKKLDEQIVIFNKYIDQGIKDQLDDWGILPSAVVFGDKIGEGAFGVVYKGVYRCREVAIKTMMRKNVSTRNLERFVGEILLLSKLHHPNVIGFVGCVLEIDTIFILLEYAGKGSLRDCQTTLGHDWSFHNHKLRVLQEICRGVSYLHALDPSIVHRDLKCENVLVTEHMVCKISDFGESRDLSDNTMTIVGTPFYIAPEVFRGENYDESADVFSFAMIICAVANKGHLNDFFKGCFKRQGLDGSAGVSGMAVPSKIAMGWRPDLPEEWERDLPTLTKLITRCWHPAYAHRPKMYEIEEILSKFWETNAQFQREERFNRRKERLSATIKEAINEAESGDDSDDDCNSSEDGETLSTSMGEATTREKKAAASLSPPTASTSTSSEYNSINLNELRGMLQNKEDELVKLRLELDALKEVVPKEKVAEIQKEVKEKHRRISGKRRASQVNNEFHFNLETMAKPARPPNAFARASSRRRVMEL